MDQVSSGPWKRRPPVWALACILLFSSGPDLAAQTREYQVKAALVYNFSRFVDWPEDAFPEKDSPLVIGVLGADPFGDYLEQMVRGEKAGNHPLVVRRFNQVDEIKTCHILFVSQSEAGRFDQILAALKRSVLTVGDAEGFAQHGGMIRFVTEKNKIRIRVNLGAARTAGLTISSKLLRSAELVTPGKD